MIDLDNLERTLELANDYVDDGLHFLTEPVSYGELKLLVERLISAEKDAARYRWLRESASTEDHGGFAYNFRLVDAIRYMPGAAPNETMGIDEAIDEAMQCSK